MKKIVFPILAVAAIFFASACDSSLEERVSKLENGRVLTVEEQVSSMRISIDRLTATDSDLKAYITQLQGSKSDLETVCGNLDAKIKELQTSLETQSSDCTKREAALKAELLGELNAYKNEIKSTLETVNSSLDSLQKKDVEIEGRITALQSFVESQISGTKDWATATFATLEQLSSVSSDISNLKSALAALDLDDIDVRLKTMSEDCGKAINNAVGALDSKLSESISAVKQAVDNCNSAIDALKEDNAKALSEAVSALESSLKDWVGEQLSGYCTIDQAEVKLTYALDSLNRSLKAQKAYCDAAVAVLRESVNADKETLKALEEKSGSLASRISSNEDEIASLRSSLSSMKEELTAQYKSVISEAVNKLDGSLSEKIGTVESKLSSDIAEVKSAVSSLISRVEAVESDLSEIKNRFSDIEKELKDLKDKLSSLVGGGIGSVSFVPEYSDGKVAVNFESGVSLSSSSDEMLFKISPADAVPVLKELYEKSQADLGLLKACAVKTKTRSDADFFDLPVKSATFDENRGTVSVVLDCSPLGVSYPANVVLQVTDGVSAVSSDYVPLFSRDYIAKYTTADSRPVNVTANSDKVLYNSYDMAEGGLIVFDETYDASAVTNYKGTFANSYIKTVSVCDAALLCDGCFYTCYELESVTLPEDVTSIPALCFNACESLKEINLPDSLTDIGIQAFKGCTLLSISKIPASLRRIHDFAFIDCASITGTLNLRNVESLGSSAFMGCSGITSVIGENVTTIRETSFYGCSQLVSAYFSHLINMGRSAFNTCPALKTVSLGNYITIISENAFALCSSLKSFSVPYSVRSIENKAFYNCTSLQSLTFQSTGFVIDKIGVSAFSGCSLKSLELNATTVDENAFANNPLESLALGSRTGYVGNGAFAGSASITVSVSAQTPPQIGGNVWDADKLVSITTPDAAAYKSAFGWNAYADKIF